jgi:hypothetical protein
MKMFTRLEKVKPHTQNLSLNLAAVKLTTVQVTKMLLYHELCKIRHNLLHKAWTDGGLVCTAYTYDKNVMETKIVNIVYI